MYGNTVASFVRCYMFKEEWKDIEGYSDLYAVSNLGRVLSKERPAHNKYKELKGIRKSRILKPFHSRRYLVVKLCRDNTEKTVLIHRLVAKAFIPLPERFKGLTFNNLEVNHIDGNPANNNVSNLEWCTKEENIKHAVVNHLMAEGKKGGDHPRARKVAMYDLQGNLLKIFNSLTDVSYFFTGKRKGSSHIAAVCRGERFTSFCHIFRYVTSIEAVETKISVPDLSEYSQGQIKRKEYDTFRSAGQSLKD